MQIWESGLYSQGLHFFWSFDTLHAYAKKLSLCLLRMLRLGPSANEPKNEAGIQREKNL